LKANRFLKKAAVSLPPETRELIEVRT